MRAVGRLRPGTSHETAAGHLAAIWPEAFNSVPVTNAASQPAPTLRVEPLAKGFSRLRDRYRRPLYALVGLAACLLVLACVNVGGLSFARLLDRREALAVQLALGAGRPRLVVQVLCEALLIGISATCLAIPIARWTAHMTTRLLWNGYGQPTLDVTPLTTMVLLAAGLGALVTLVAGAPALIGLRIQNWDLSARNVGHGAMTGRRRAVVAVQIALCLVLTFCAALFVANLRALGRLPLGYEPDRLTWAQLNFKNRAPSAAAPTIGYIDSLLSRIEGLPGVESAALSQAGFGTKIRGFLDPVPARAEGLVPNVDAVIDLVSPGFFQTTAISIQRGRDFTWDDVRTRAGIAIVNRSLAARLFDKGDALGRTIRIGRGRREQALSIVGIVADATPGDPRFQHVPQCYVPLAPEAPPIPTLLLRLAAGSVPEELLRKEIEPWGHHEVLRATTMSEQIDRLLVQERLIRSTSVLFAVLAGVVGSAGLYAVLSQSISRRTREIGIRAALGATPNRIRALIFTEVSWILLIGVGLGVPAAWTGGRVARILLSHPPANFLTLLAGVGVAIVVVAAFVAAWPAQRATRVPTATALRAE
jgi:predicted permease